MYRDHTKVVQIGNKKIGGGNPILIQSMTNTKTEDVEATVRQILELEAAGCDIIRCAVPTMEAAQALKEIKKLLLNKARLEATLEESLLDGKKPVKKSAHASKGFKRTEISENTADGRRRGRPPGRTVPLYKSA